MTADVVSAWMVTSTDQSDMSVVYLMADRHITTASSLTVIGETSAIESVVSGCSPNEADVG